MRRTQLAIAGVGILLLAGGSAGCVSTHACPSWADFSDPNAAAEQADVIYIGHVVRRDGDVKTSLGAARGYDFAIESAPKGGHAPQMATIGSRPDTCDGGDGYVAGDELRTSNRVLVYLDQDEDGLVTLAPGQGVTDFPVDTALPFSTK